MSKEVTEEALDKLYEVRAKQKPKKIGMLLTHDKKTDKLLKWRYRYELR